MTDSDRAILVRLANGPATADELAAATGVSPRTAARRARRLWRRLAVNREPILTGRGGRPRLRYLAGLETVHHLKGESE